MKASLWIFSLCLTFQALGVHKGFAQSTPQWLFAADAPTVQAYHLSASVSGAEEYQAFTKPVRNREAVAYPGEKSSQLFIERGKAGQNWTLFFQEDELQYALLNERSSWRKCPGTAGLVYDTTSLMVISTHLRDFDSLLLWLPDVQASAATVGLGSKDGNQQFAYLLNEAGWPIAEAHYQSGELLALSTYAYQFDEGGRWTKRFVHNRLSGQQKEVSRYLVEHAGKTGQGWMAVDGGTGFWLLEENGNALYWNGQAMRPLPGSWTKTSEQLTIERKDWTEARRFIIEEFAWGWQVKSEADEQEDWVWTVALDYDTRKLRRWQEAAMVSSYEVFEDKERVGLRDEGGTTQIEAKYDALQPIMPGLAIVGLEDRFGLLQLNGMSLLPIYFERLQYLGDSLLLGQRSGKQGVIHLAGDTILPFEFDRLIAIDEASYWMFQEGKMGMIDNMGNVLIEPEFDLIQPFLDGQALAMADGQTGVIDASGQWIIEPGVYAGVTPVGLSGYLVQTDASSWGFADRSGSLQVAPEYGHLRALGATTLIAQQEGRFGLLSISGEVLAPLSYRMLKGCGDYSVDEGFCEALTAQNVVAQYVSDDEFGYLDALGRRHPPALPSAEVIAQGYQVQEVEEGLIFTFPLTWALEESINKLYKEGDYGQSRVVYEFLPAEGQGLADWASLNVEKPLLEARVGGQAALTYTERDRVRYYDFFRKHLYCLSRDGQKIIHLEFSCKDANFLESIPHLFEIEQLIRFADK